MNKIWILLVLAVVIAGQASFLSSFHKFSTEVESFDTFNATGTSAVIVAKPNYLSVRVKFFIRAKPGETALVVLPDGTQKNVTSAYQFEVFLPKTGSHQGSFSAYAPGDIFLTDTNPIQAKVKSTVTEDFFSSDFIYYPDGRITDSDGIVTVYMFKVQGNAQVIVAGYGVAM